MPPKKKQKTASLSPSRRSRTRSASVVSAAPPTKKGKRRLVKAEPLDDDPVFQQESDQEARLSPVWNGDVQPETECWVELPAAPTLEEDRLMFVRPKNKETWKEKGKHKEQPDDSPVLHVDYAPDECDPFHFAAEDLEDASSKLVAVRPKSGKQPRKGKPAPASVQAASLAVATKPTETTKPSSLRAPEASGSNAPAQSSSASTSAPATFSQQPSQSKNAADQKPTASAPLLLPEASKIKVQGVTRAAELLSLMPSQPTNGGLEDMFLGSNHASVSNQVEREDGAPLFFENSSDEESKLASQTPVGSQAQRPTVKLSPTRETKPARPALPADAGGSSARPGNAASSTINASSKAQKRKKAEERMEKEKERMREKRVERARKKEKNRKREELKERERQKEKEKQKSAALQVDSDSDSDSDDDDDRGKHRSDDVKNLRSELNEDAFARSTGVRHKEEYRNKLARFSQARKKARQERGESISSSSRSSASSDDDDAGVRGKRKRLGNGQRATTVSSGSETSSSDSESDGSDDSSSSAESKDFIVADDEVEYDGGFQPESSSPVPARSQPAPAIQRVSGGDRRRFERDGDGRIRLIPISAEPFSGTSGSVLAAHGLSAGGGRKGLDEMCFDWLEWAVARVLVTWSALSLPDRERLERNRAALRSRMRSTEESVGSVTMRRQFKWYLTQYPKIDVQPVFRDEVERFGSLAKNGCGICHRKSQKAQFKVTFSGLRYDQHNLAPLKKHRSSDSSSSASSSSSSSDSSSDSDSDSDSESDRSDDNETWREAGEDETGRPTYTFYAGNHCAQRAAVMHQLHHWEWTTMQTLAKHDSIRYVRRQLWRPSRSGRGKDGRMGAGAYEVALCVEEMISPSGRCTWRGKEKEGKKSSALSELDRLRRRLKSLNEQAIEVNRAR